MQILGINMTLKIRRARVINMATNLRWILSSNHEIRIVRVDLMGDDKGYAPIPDPRGMKILGVRRG